MIGWLRFGLRWAWRGFLALSMCLWLVIGAASLLFAVSTSAASAIMSRIAANTGYAIERRDRIEASRKVNWKGKSVPAHQAVSEASSGIRSRLVASGRRSLGTAAAEALPFVGVGVIVAATAYELQQACELSKELRDLELAFKPDQAAEEGEICGFTPPSRRDVWTQVTTSPAAAWAQARAIYATVPPLALSDRYEAGLRSMTAFYENLFDGNSLGTSAPAAP